MTTDLHLHAARMATARAHLAGAEAAELEAEAGELMARAGQLLDAADDTRRRYWRECAAAALLTGWNWASAERLGVEP